MEVYASEKYEIRNKRDWSPVTTADMNSHLHLVEALADLLPGTPILSEEDPDATFEIRRHWHHYWLVDPLDGTSEFIDRNNDFSVNIALMEKQVPILGVVHGPVEQCSWFAVTGGGAFKKTPGGAIVPIHTRPIGDECIVVLGSRSHGSDLINDFVAGLGEHSLIKMGSALKSCMVAEGKADVYPRFGPTSEWDTAAAQIIVEEAGGAFTDLDLQPLTYNGRETLLNPHFLVVGDTRRDWKKLLP